MDLSCFETTELSPQTERNIELMKRVILSQSDMDIALYSAKKIQDLLQEECPDVKLIRALETTLKVSYWRPFTKHENTSGVKDTLPEGKFLADFNDENRKMHTRIKDDRNQHLAHSSNEAYSLKISINKESALVSNISRQPLTIPSSHDIRTIIENIELILKNLLKEETRIKEYLLYSEEIKTAYHY